MDKIKLYGFNNLTKTLSFNMYDICYAVSEEDKKGYIEYINNQYNSARLTKILTDVTQIIGANILNIAKQDYEPQGASVNLLISEEAIPLYALDPSCTYRDQAERDKTNEGNVERGLEVVQIPDPKHLLGHLDKSHITVHTYPESHPDEGIMTFRVDIDVSTCGTISPLLALDYLVECFDSDIMMMDYRVRGFTRDTAGKKIFIDHTINSIGDYISEKNKENYNLIDVNLCHEQTFHSKMMKKEFILDDYLFESNEVDFTPEQQQCLRKKIQKEMAEIYNVKNRESRE
jgi:S-adenosylmethionine decarboxylase